MSMFLLNLCKKQFFLEHYLKSCVNIFINKITIKVYLKSINKLLHTENLFKLQKFSMYYKLNI